MQQANGVNLAAKFKKTCLEHRVKTNGTFRHRAAFGAGYTVAHGAKVQTH
jgi:hypothetical protein